MKALQAIVIATICGQAATAFAYRTNGDLPELAGTDRVVWSRPAPELRLHVDGVPGLSFTHSEAAVRRALAVWADPEQSSFRPAYGGATTEAAAPSDGSNTIEWVRFSWERRGFPSNAAATTDTEFELVDGVWTIRESDIYANADTYRWLRSGGDPEGITREVLAVTTHELGHFASVLHNCEPAGQDDAPVCASIHEDAVMFPLYQGHRILSADDVAAIAFLYPRQACDVTGCPVGTQCVAGRCAETCGAAICAEGEVCKSWGCALPECLNAACTVECSGDEDCSAGERCSSGVCRRNADRGDPCAEDTDCSVVCASEGYCTTYCSSDAACSDGFSCSSTGTCGATLGVYGAACRAPDDCTSALCFVRGGVGSCTRECTASAACPSGHVCTELGGRNVCAPPTPSGCSVAQDGTESVGALVALVVLLLRRRRT